MSLTSVVASAAGEMKKNSRQPSIVKGTRYASVTIRIPQAALVPWWTPADSRHNTEFHARESAMTLWEDTFGKMSERDAWQMEVHMIHARGTVTCDVRVAPSE